MKQLVDGAGQPVDDGHGVQAFQQPSPPLAGDGQEEQRFLKRYAIQLGQAVDPGGGEDVTAGGRNQGRGVGDGLHHPLTLQPRHGLVHRAPGPAGEGGQFQPVQEGHIGQTAQGVGFATGGNHSSSSPPSACCRSMSNSRYRLRFSPPASPPPSPALPSASDSPPSGFVSPAGGWKCLLRCSFLPWPLLARPFPWDGGTWLWRMRSTSRRYSWTRWRPLSCWAAISVSGVR